MAQRLPYNRAKALTKENCHEFYNLMKKKSWRTEYAYPIPRPKCAKSYEKTLSLTDELELNCSNCREN